MTSETPAWQLLPAMRLLAEARGVRRWFVVGNNYAEVSEKASTGKRSPTVARDGLQPPGAGRTSPRPSRHLSGADAWRAVPEARSMPPSVTSFRRGDDGPWATRCRMTSGAPPQGAGRLRAVAHVLMLGLARWEWIRG
jgi:hypothetical protein